MDGGASSYDEGSASVRFTGAACLLFSGPRLVLEVRKEHKWQRLSGKPVQIGIGCVGGTIEPGETPVQALRREARKRSAVRSTCGRPGVRRMSLQRG